MADDGLEQFSGCGGDVRSAHGGRESYRAQWRTAVVHSLPRLTRCCNGRSSGCV